MKKSSNEVQIDETLTVPYWRERFDVLYENPKDWSRKDLVQYDKYFLSAAGKDAVRNVKEGRGGLEPTMRVVKALERLFADRDADAKSEAKILKKQKLVIQ